MSFCTCNTSASCHYKQVYYCSTVYLKFIISKIIDKIMQTPKSTTMFIVSYQTDKLKNILIVTFAKVPEALNRQMKILEFAQWLEWSEDGMAAGYASFKT